MTEEQRNFLEWVSTQLMYGLPATPIKDGEIVLPVGENGEAVWRGNMTTYTLGLMLSGMVALDREGK